MHAHFKEGRLPTESEHNVIRNKNKKQSSLGWASLWGKSVGVFPPHLPPPSHLLALMCSSQGIRKGCTAQLARFDMLTSQRTAGHYSPFWGYPQGGATHVCAPAPVP